MTPTRMRWGTAVAAVAAVALATASAVAALAAPEPEEAADQVVLTVEDGGAGIGVLSGVAIDHPGSIAVGSGVGYVFDVAEQHLLRWTAPFEGGTTLGVVDVGEAIAGVLAVDRDDTAYLAMPDGTVQRLSSSGELQGRFGDDAIQGVGSLAFAPHRPGVFATNSGAEDDPGL